MNTYGLTINHNKSAYTYNCNKAMEPIYAQGKEIPIIAKMNHIYTWAYTYT